MLCFPLKVINFFSFTSIRELVIQFRQRGLTFYVSFHSFVLCIEGLHLLGFVRPACGSCYLSEHLVANLSSSLYLFLNSNNFFVYPITDLGVSFALCTHLMGSHVGCWTIWPLLVVRPFISFFLFCSQLPNLHKLSLTYW